MSANESSSSTGMNNELAGLSSAIALVYGRIAILVNGDSYTFIPEWASFLTTEPRQLMIIHVARHVSPGPFTLRSIHNIRIERIWEEVQAQGSWHIDAADSIHGPSIPIPTNPTPALIQGQGHDEGYQSDN